MKLEGLEEADNNIKQGEITIQLAHTNTAEIARIANALDILFKQGAFNIRHGGVQMHFNDKGWLKALSFKATKWQDGEEIALRVASFEKAIVQIENVV